MGLINLINLNIMHFKKIHKISLDVTIQGKISNTVI